MNARRMIGWLGVPLLSFTALIGLCQSQSGQRIETITLVCPSLPVVVRTRDDYIYTPGLGAHKLHESPLTWNVARKICATEGAHLAITNSEAEALKLARMFREIRLVNGTDDYGHAWLGFHGHFDSLDFVTIHGDSLISTGHTTWQKHEPNGHTERCGSMGKDDSLSDNRCDQNIAFFCKIPSKTVSVRCDL